MTKEDIQGYEEFMHNTCSFISTAMTLLRQQKEAMVVLNTELQKHLQILSIQQDLIKSFGKQTTAHKVLLIEQESRILDLEQAVYRGNYSEASKKVPKLN